MQGCLRNNYFFLIGLKYWNFVCGKFSYYTIQRVNNKDLVLIRFVELPVVEILSNIVKKMRYSKTTQKKTKIWFSRQIIA